MRSLRTGLHVGNKLTVLVVEDEDAIRLPLRDFLVTKGYTVVVASDGAGAIEQLLDHDIDVIISDYRMSVLGGHYWIRFLERYCPEKKIIITSGYLDSDIEHPFPLFKKPFEFQDLFLKIESMVHA
ncbi:MAG: response regulator [Spirochaetales bacterium]|jgi:CheY-like chemotaxis protein|nr:response regulator [Spirochaetales bacterium]